MSEAMIPNALTRWGRRWAGGVGATHPSPYLARAQKRLPGRPPEGPYHGGVTTSPAVCHFFTVTHAETRTQTQVYLTTHVRMRALER